MIIWIKTFLTKWIEAVLFTFKTSCEVPKQANPTACELIRVTHGKEGKLARKKLNTKLTGLHVHPKQN